MDMQIPICGCGRPYSLDAGVVLDVTLDGVNLKYSFCSSECLQKRIDNIPEVNKEIGVDVRIISKEVSNKTWILILSSKEEDGY